MCAYRGTCGTVAAHSELFGSQLCETLDHEAMLEGRLHRSDRAGRLDLVRSSTQLIGATKATSVSPSRVGIRVLRAELQHVLRCFLRTFMAAPSLFGVVGRSRSDACPGKTASHFSIKSSSNTHSSNTGIHSYKLLPGFLLSAGHLHHSKPCRLDCIGAS